MKIENFKTSEIHYLHFWKINSYSQFSHAHLSIFWPQTESLDLSYYRFDITYIYPECSGRILQTYIIIQKYRRFHIVLFINQVVINNLIAFFNPYS